MARENFTVASLFKDCPGAFLEYTDFPGLENIDVVSRYDCTSIHLVKC